MSLQIGDFFEGFYQLKEELSTENNEQRTRWLVDDYTDNQKKEVVIDIHDSRYDNSLHWQYEVPGLQKIGLTPGTGNLFVVWEKDKVQDLSPISVENIPEKEKEGFIELINTLPILPNETILSEESPDYWHTNYNGKLILYRKQVTQHADPEVSISILESWKVALLPPNSPQIRPDYPLPLPPPSIPPDRTDPKIPLRGMLVAIGIILAIVAYLIKPPPPPPTVDFSRFNQAIDSGIAQERNGEYQRAIDYFKEAADFPLTEQIRKRVDSLSRAYESFARSECERYKLTKNPELYFIPDQYYHYASVLTNTPAQKCE